MDFTAALAGFAASAGLIIAIGAQNAFVLRQGLLRRHVALVVGICMLGDIALILCGVAGVGRLVREWPALLDALRYGGAAFLAWYGLLAARRAWRGGGGLAAAAEAPDAGARRTALACLAFTFLNPHVYLDTMVLLGGISTQYAHARAAFALGACAASVAWFTTLGYGARLLQPVFRKPAAWQVLDACIAAFMLGIALLLVLRPLA